MAMLGNVRQWGNEPSVMFELQLSMGSDLSVQHTESNDGAQFQHQFLY